MGEMGGAIGAWYNMADEGVVRAYSAFATEKQANALSDAYPYQTRMVPRTAAMAKRGWRRDNGYAWGDGCNGGGD